MKTLLRISFFFLLATQICIGHNSSKSKNISQVFTDGKVITDTTILVKRIDHIVAYYNSIEEVDSMIKLFNGVLVLPQWFLPSIRDVVSPPNSKFYNTGVYLGNVFLEFITFKVDASNPLPRTYVPYFKAFAFTNEIQNTAAILDARGLARSQVSHFLFREPDQSILTLFSNISLTNIYNNNLLVFFCQYHPELFDCASFDFSDLPAITNPDEQHIYYNGLLESMDGGPLTVKKVKNLIVKSTNVETYRQLFNKLFLPTVEGSDGKWSPSAGPSLILQEGQTPITVTGINIEVASLEAAKDYLASKGLGFQESTDNLRLDLSANIGMEITLTEIVSYVDNEIIQPTHFILEQNYPNPFNPKTQINYAIPQNSFIELKVFNLLGQEVTTLVNQEKSTGTYEVNFDASGLSSGIYFYQINSGNFVDTKKMILLK